MLKRRAVTLIEMLISMTLFVLLLSSLFFWYRHLSVHKGELEKIKRPIIAERHLWQRLNQIFPKVKPPFFSEEGLVFRFDRGLFENPALSDTVLGKLYHDSDTNTFCLSVWPDPKDEIGEYPSQTFLLLDQVKEISYRFYSPPNPFKLTVDPKQVGKPEPAETWNNTTWRAEYNTLPAFIEMTITRLDNKAHILVFDLERPILYPMEGT